MISLSTDYFSLGLYLRIVSLNNCYFYTGWGKEFEKKKIFFSQFLKMLLCMSNHNFFFQLAYANFYPKLVFDPANCNIDKDKYQSVINEATDAMKAVVSNGYTPYLCRFQDTWFTQFRDAYPTLDANTYNLLKTARTDQTRCETQFMGPWMRNNVPGFVWRVKDDCVYPTEREEETPIPPLIQPGWP